MCHSQSITVSTLDQNVIKLAFLEAAQAGSIIWSCASFEIVWPDDTLWKFEFLEKANMSESKAKSRIVQNAGNEFKVCKGCNKVDTSGSILKHVSQVSACKKV